MSLRPQGRDVGVDRGALRWPWGGGSGEAQLGLGSSGREGWGLGAKAQMVKDPARNERVGEGGDAVAAAAARGAAQHVDREGPLEELGPALALCLGARVGFGLGFGLVDAWRGTGPAGWDGGGDGGDDGAAGDDGIAQGRGRGEDAEVGPLVLARVGDQGGEALEEGEGVEDEGPRAVAPGAAEGPLDPVVPADLEAAPGEGWAGDVANEAISVVGSRRRRLTDEGRTFRLAVSATSFRTTRSDPRTVSHPDEPEVTTGLNGAGGVSNRMRPRSHASRSRPHG